MGSPCNNRGVIPRALAPVGIPWIFWPPHDWVGLPHQCAHWFAMTENPSLQDTGLFCQLQIGGGEFSEISMYGFCPGHYHNIPAGLEFFFIEAVNFPETAAHTVAHMGLAQFFADGDANTVFPRLIFAGVENQITVGIAGGGIQAPENVVQF